MTKIENKEGVKEITLRPVAFVKCKIGQDWYKCEFEAVFIPGPFYPDYMEVNAFVMSEIDGQEMNIEEAAKVLYEHLMQYKPKELKVVNHIHGCKTHFDVDVTL